MAQRKLAPWALRDGSSIEPRRAPNEGAIDTYYAMATPVDWLGFGPWRLELPLVLFWGPTALLVLLFLAGRRAPPLRASASRLGPGLLVLLCLGAGGLGLPVLFTTAGGLETEAFAVVYFLGFALLVDEAVRCFSTRAAGLPAG